MNSQFLIELRELMRKYNASIVWGCAECSDTYGIYGENIEIKSTAGGCIISSGGFEASDLDSIS